MMWCLMLLVDSVCGVNGLIGVFSFDGVIDKGW